MSLKLALLTPFQKEDSVAYLACKVCGDVVEELDITGAIVLAGRAGMEGVELPHSYTGKYFEIDGCVNCSTDENNKVSLKNIYSSLSSF